MKKKHKLLCILFIYQQIAADKETRTQEYTINE